MINIHTHFIDKKTDSILNICVGVKRYKYYKTFFSAGIHPWHVSTKTESILWNELKLLVQNEKCIAIGEIGLDKNSNIDFEVQKGFFELQLKFAESKNLPVIIHCVKSFDQILFFRNKYNKTPWIIHDFSGSKELSEQLIKKNIFLSLGNIFINNYSKIQKILPFLPLEKMFFETDNKFFTIESIYKKASSILNVSEKKLKNQILNNFKLVFNGLEF